MKIYIDGFKELPMGCRECKLKNRTSWFCQMVNPNIKINENEYYDNQFKHPDCPLRIED